MLLCRMLILAALTLATLYPQGFDRPPAGVQETLTAEIEKFYTLEMEGKFRNAEGMVCDGSKDAYYDSRKRRWEKFEIMKYSYQDDFKTAKVMVLLQTRMTTAAGPIPVKVPLATEWKLQGSGWCYYLPPPSSGPVETPFGKMFANSPEGAAKSPQGGPGTMPVPVSLEELRKSVQVSKTTLKLDSAAKSSDFIEVSNAMPGRVTLEMSGSSIPGLKWSISPKVIQSGEKSTITFEYDPPAKAALPTATFTLIAEPVAVSFPLKVEFAPPPAGVK